MNVPVSFTLLASRIFGGMIAFESGPPHVPPNGNTSISCVIVGQTGSDTLTNPDPVTNASIYPI